MKIRELKEIISDKTLKVSIIASEVVETYFDEGKWEDIPEELLEKEIKDIDYYSFDYGDDCEMLISISGVGNKRKKSVLYNTKECVAWEQSNTIG